MKKFLFFILTFNLLMIPLFSLCAETFEEVVDRHYENLAKIVIGNMKNPEQCIDGIGLYMIDAMEEFEKQYPEQAAEIFKMDIDYSLYEW